MSFYLYLCILKSCLRTTFRKRQLRNNYRMIEIRTVSKTKDIERFIDFRTALYKDDPCAVPYLFKDEKDTLMPNRNPAFDFCEAEYYMAYRDGKPVGRVAAIINHHANEKWGRKNVRFGYFDFIDDGDVSRALIDKVCDYGRAHGMDTIIGPMGFTDMDREGMLRDSTSWRQCTPIITTHTTKNTWRLWDSLRITTGFSNSLPCLTAFRRSLRR